MTHTLHRRGAAGRAEDWVVLAMAARGPARRGAVPRLRRFLELARRYRPVNLGDMRTGPAMVLPFEDLLAGVDEASIVHAVFDREASVRELLSALRTADLGLSVVVTGELDRADRCCRKVGLEPHTVAMSLGVWGRTDRLPDAGVLDITAMCGHGAVAPSLVSDTVQAVRDGRMDLAAGVARIGRPCVCGVFNPSVAAERLASLIEES